MGVRRLVHWVRMVALAHQVQIYLLQVTILCIHLSRGLA
jgi:hypothetical protein